MLNTFPLMVEYTTTISRCPVCWKETVKETAVPYNAIDIDGNQAYVENLAVVQCTTCGKIMFTKESNEQISARLRDTCGLLQPSVIYAWMTANKEGYVSLAYMLNTPVDIVDKWLGRLHLQTRRDDVRLRSLFAWSQRKAE